MNEDNLKKHLKQAIDQAPIDLLEKIKAQPVEKMAAHDDITRQSTSGKVRYLKPTLALLSAAAIFLFAFVNWQMTTQWVDSMVYLDVNPSLALETNRRDQVIRLSGLDDESQALIEGLDYKGKSLEAVAAELLDRLVLQGYVSSSEPAILLSVFNEDPEKRSRQLTELDQAIHAYLKSLEIQPIVLTQTLDPTETLSEYAEANHISVSKMTLIRNMILLDPDLKTEDLAKLSLEALIKVSSKVELNLEQIIQSSDMERIKTLDDFDEDDPEDLDDDNDDGVEDVLDDLDEDDGDLDDDHDDDDDDFDDTDDNDTMDDAYDLDDSEDDDSLEDLDDDNDDEVEDDPDDVEDDDMEDDDTEDDD